MDCGLCFKRAICTTIAWSVEIAKISQWPSGAGGATPLTSLKTTGEVGLQCDALPGDCIAREGNRRCILSKTNPYELIKAFQDVAVLSGTHCGDN